MRRRLRRLSPSRPQRERCPWRAPHQCRDEWSGSRPSTRTAPRCPWCQGLTTRQQFRSGVQCLFRDLVAAWNGNLDFDVSGLAELRRGFLNGSRDHRARRRIDRWLAGRDRQSGPCHHANTRACFERHARAGQASAHGHNNQRAVRHVRIVTCVLNDGRGSGVCGCLCRGEGERRRRAAWKRDLNRIGKGAGPQRFDGSACGCGGAGASCPAIAERSRVFSGRVCHGVGYHVLRYRGRASAVTRNNARCR